VDFQVLQMGSQYELTLGRNEALSQKNQRLTLSSLEFQYFQQMTMNLSIEEVVRFFLQQGWLVSFRVLFNLLEKLVQFGLIRQKEIIELISPSFLSQKNLNLTDLGIHHTKQVHLNGATLSEVKMFPFFRSLPENLVSLLLKEARLYLVPAGVALVRQKDTDRDLFVLKSGQAAVIQKNKVIALLPQYSVFGEGAFFMGKPRSADVVSTQATEVLRIKYSAEIESQIKMDKAEKLQKRFWALHGLLNSTLFNSLPLETFDRFLMLGNVKVVPANLVLIQEGARGYHFYILIRGEIQISQKGVLLRKLGPGEVLGEVALMVSQGVRTASAVTLSECHLIEIEQHEFYKNLSQNLILAKEIEEIAFLRWQNQ